ncbi:MULTISPECIES: SsgA family sporulation/cell division regulator [Streptomyces]|uniref:SsgA family sporulation/cell division regulator n=1 Tax=Streptomyces chengmaiensis TaxID=3040919 RepID=A0ABT6HLH7_9ACTN|nr:MULTISPECIES: SsgA family sporulation/cell division regulator [Streptomyces]MDH2389118.1 SsgA family sporulation/cell division regulator [Streptomyces chengmaiensis]WRQ82632.1 SsgA family sporulation/cell division regulator [Streptomyces sp. MUM 178J]
MSPTVEEHARARIVTDAPQYRQVRVTLGYDPSDHPSEVRFSFPSGRAWEFPRDVLEQGLRGPARSGDVEVWPCGRVQTVVEFHTPDGVAVVQFDSSELKRFLRHTREAAGSVTRG